jgi:hypothetical protein
MKTKQQDYTLSELRALKSDWIQQAGEQSIPSQLYKIVRNLGQRFENEFPSWRQNDPAWRVVRGNVRAMLFHRSGSFMPDRGEFSWTYTLMIQVGDSLVCKWKFGNHPLDPAENLFVPGQWVNELQALGLDAEAKVAAEAIRRQEIERRELMAELLIGTEV